LTFFSAAGFLTGDLRFFFSGLAAAASSLLSAPSFSTTESIFLPRFLVVEMGVFGVLGDFAAAVRAAMVSIVKLDACGN